MTKFLKTIYEPIHIITSLIFLIAFIVAMIQDNYQEASMYGFILIYSEISDLNKNLTKAKLILGIKDDKETENGTKNHMYN